MPIEILELVIKVTIEEKKEVNSYRNKQELISECVEQTIKRMDYLKER